MTKIERNKLKKLLHQLVVVRDKKCLRCPATKRLNASHIYSKGSNPSIQWEPWNVKALCWACHLMWWHKSPLEAARWFKIVYPDRHKKALALYNKANKVGLKQKTVYDYETIKTTLEKEIKKYEKNNRSTKKCI